eukprot:6500928-Pyramimonas_sp.AAC.1
MKTFYRKILRYFHRICTATTVFFAVFSPYVHPVCRIFHRIANVGQNPRRPERLSAAARGAGRGGAGAGGPSDHAHPDAGDPPGPGGEHQRLQAQHRDAPRARPRHQHQGAKTRHGPIKRRKRGYIFITDQSDAGSVGIFS